MENNKIYLVFSNSFDYSKDEYISELKKGFKNKKDAENYIDIQTLPIIEMDLEHKRLINKLKELSYSNSTMKEYDKVYNEIQNIRLNINNYKYEIVELDLE